MRRQRGFTFLEITTGLSLMVLTMTAVVALLIGGLRSLDRPSTSVELSQSNAQGLRRVSDALREAMSVTISNDGRTVTYVLPKRMASVDAITGEKELIDPMVSDGVSRTFAVTTSGTLTGGGRTYVRNIALVDPEPTSTQYNQNYQPFQMTTIGATRSLSINLITRSTKNGRDLYFRMKTTVMLRNAR